jgi:hypothetical protein
MSNAAAAAMSDAAEAATSDASAASMSLDAWMDAQTLELQRQGCI